MANEWTTVTCSEEPTVTKNEDGTFDVRIFDPNKKDLLDYMDEYDIVCHFDEEKLLSYINEETCRKYYNFPEDDGSDTIEDLEKEIEKLKDDLADKEKEIENLKSGDYLQFEEIPKK